MKKKEGKKDEEEKDEEKEREILESSSPSPSQGKPLLKLEEAWKNVKTLNFVSTVEIFRGFGFYAHRKVNLGLKDSLESEMGLNGIY